MKLPWSITDARVIVIIYKFSFSKVHTEQSAMYSDQATGPKEEGETESIERHFKVLGIRSASGC